MEAKEEPAGKKVARKKPERYDVKTKCAAVLAIWSERRKPAEVCRELGIHWGVLSGWQNRAMEGMVQGLSPKATGENRPTALSPLLERRLTRKLARQTIQANKLQQRLKAIQPTGSGAEKPKE
jgi:transposase-like protein